MNTKKLILITPIFILLSHHLALFLHEYAHSFTAWYFGYKSNPLDLHYGGTSLENFLFLIYIDQNVDAKMIFALGHPVHAGIIALAGVLMNVFLFVLSYWMLTCERIKKHDYLFYFLVFFNLMNLGNLYDYVPIRTFMTEGSVIDIVDIEKGFNLSPWIVFAAAGYPLAFLIGQFFTKTLNAASVNLNLTRGVQTFLMIVCIVILFGFYAVPGLLSSEKVPFFIAATSVLAMPGMVLMLWLRSFIPITLRT